MATTPQTDTVIVPKRAAPPPPIRRPSKENLGAPTTAGAGSEAPNAAANVDQPAANSGLSSTQPVLQRSTTSPLPPRVHSYSTAATGRPLPQPGSFAKRHLPQPSGGGSPIHDRPLPTPQSPPALPPKPVASTDANSEGQQAESHPPGAPPKIPGGLRKLPPRPKSMSASVGTPKKTPPPIVRRMPPKRPANPPPQINLGNTTSDTNPELDQTQTKPETEAEPRMVLPEIPRAATDGHSRFLRAHTSAPRPNRPTATRPRSPSGDEETLPAPTYIDAEGFSSTRSTELTRSFSGPGLSTEGEKTYLQIDLNALDIESLYPQPKKSMKHSNSISSLASSSIASLKNKFFTLHKSKSSGSANTMTTDTNEPDISEEELNKWPSVQRTRRQWGPRDETGVPQEVLSLINPASMDLGYNIEIGDKNAPRDPPLVVDHQGEYVHYYRDNIYCTDHTNYIGADEESELYVIVSAENPKGKRDKVRALVRTRKDYTRLLLDAKQDHIKALKAAMPELAKINFMKVKSQELADELMKMEEKEVVLGTRYKFGVLYVRPGQTEDEIYANENPSADFEEFLDMLGDRITLQGWDKYKGGLDVKNGSTGTHSLYKTIHGIEIMFHVCTMLPAQVLDVQRVERKRHIGNDVVTFVFLEQGCEPFNPQILTSQFIHIVVVVRKIPGDGPTRYAISISTKAGVEPHSPALPNPSIFEKSEKLRDFLLTKCINAERTAMLSPEFRSKMLRSRKEFLKLMYTNFKKTKK